MGPRIVMAPAAWDDTTTNRKSAISGVDLSEAVRRAEMIGEEVVTPFRPLDNRPKK